MLIYVDYIDCFFGRNIIMSVPYLCGGIFFWILTQYRNSKINEKELLSRLLIISKMTKSDLSQEDNFNFYTSNFKSCKDNIFSKSTIIFEDGEKYFLNAFKDNKGSDILEDTKLFTKKHINEGYYNELAQVLLDLIVSDETISNDEEFYINWDVWPIKKQALIELKSICIEALILGVWQYIVCNRANDNPKGKETYNKWGQGKKNTAKRILYSPVHKFDIHVYSCNGEKESSDVLSDSDKDKLKEFLTDIGIIKRAVNKMNESSNISLTLVMNIGKCSIRWKDGGEVFSFKNETLKYRILELINTLNAFSACFRKSYNGHQKERADVLARLKYLLNSDFFQSDDALIILPTINH